MKISKILAGMSAAAIVASMAMIPASAAGTKLNVSDDLLKIARQTQDDLFAVYFNGKDEDMPNKDAIADLGTVYGASFTIKVDNNDWNTIGGGLSSSTHEPPAQSLAFQPPDFELKLIDPPPPIVFQSLLSTLIVNEAP